MNTPTCSCGTIIKPYHPKANVPGVGEVISSKPIFPDKCEKCRLELVLRKRP